MARPDDELLATISVHAASLLRIARTHSLCADDAQDAYQRTLELFLRRFDEVRPGTAGEWLRTVCKHEAIRLRDARQRLVATDPAVWDARTDAEAGDGAERAVAMERVAHAAEALQGCKADESTAILLKAGGASYADIEARTGWSYTKVNRALTEGRRRFLRAFADIESGAACASYAPVLSLVADGEATPEDYVALRPHLRHCAGCRASLRGLYEAQPALGALVPAGLLAAPVLASPGAADAPARLLTRVYEAAVTGAGDRLLRAQALVEAVTTSKAAAVAATAAVAAGGVATVGGAGPPLPPGNPAIARAVGPAGAAARERAASPLPAGSAAAAATPKRRAAVGARSAGDGRGRTAAARAVDDERGRTTAARAAAATEGRRAATRRPATAATRTGVAGRGGSAARPAPTPAPARTPVPAPDAAPASSGPVTAAAPTATTATSGGGDFGFEG